jgi:hypothetical protein
MNVRPRIITLAATALIAATSFAGATATLASAALRPQVMQPDAFVAHAWGYGATLTAAESDARLELIADYGGCVGPYTIIGNGQETNGTWWAEIEGECKSYV